MSIALSSAGGGFPTAGITPPEVVAEVINALLGGAPFAASLTRRPTSANSTTWPVVAPTGMTWTGEGQPLPQVVLGDKAYNVVPKKLAGVYSLSNELMDDATISAFSLLGDAVRDAAGPELDAGLLNGTGGVAPVGVVGLATAVSGGDLRTAAFAAAAEIGEEGGAANTLALSPSAIATEGGRSGTDGHPIYPNGFATLGALNIVAVPGLLTPLVYDATRIYLLVRNDFEVAGSPDAGFTSDVTVARIKGRFAAAVPVAEKAIRKLTVGAGTQAAGTSGSGSSTYDPSDHTVAEVNDYLDAHPDERDAVLDAERAGQHRVGITDR